MINKATLQLTFLIVISTNLPALEHTDKKRIIAVEILSFSFGGFLGYYGTQAGNGRYEIGLGLGYFEPNGANVNAIGFYPSIRAFHSGYPKGLFYEAGFGLGRFNWDYKGSYQPIKKILLFPSLYLGYRVVSSKLGLALTSYLGTNYISSSLQAPDGKIARFGDIRLNRGLSPALGVEIGYLF